MAEPILRLEGVHLNAPEGRSVFEGLAWSLERGGRVRLAAPSGAGGTAFLRLCAGLAMPDQGEVWLDGHRLDPFAFSHPFLARGAMGWVPSGGGLLVNQTLLANLILPLRFARGMAQGEAENLGLEMLKRAGLFQHTAQRPHALEARERWLAALARAALSTPELWLVDDPPGDLDLGTIRAAQDLLGTSLAEPGVSAVFLGSGPWIPPEAHPWKLENGRILEDTP